MLSILRALKLLIVLFHAQVFTDTPPKPTSAFYAASLECASGSLDNNDVGILRRLHRPNSLNF